MTKSLKMKATGFAFALLPFASVAAPVIVNGGFEADPYTGNYSPNPTITGWTKVGSNGVYPLGVNNAGGLGPTPYGSQFVVMGLYGGGGGGLTQTVSGFDVGSTYTLNFAISSEGGGNARLQVGFDSGSSTASAIFLAPAAITGKLWDAWQDMSYNFVATSASVAFRFSDISSLNGGYDIGLDHVSLTGGTTSVPEPASLALVAVGLVGLGLSRRRQA